MFEKMLWPALQALIALGGSAAIDELDNAVIAREGWSEEQQAVLHRDGPRTLIEYRLAWARTYLKGMGLVTNSRRRVWTVTERGRSASEDEITPLYRAFSAENRRRTAELRAQRVPGEPGGARPEATTQRTSAVVLDPLLPLPSPGGVPTQAGQDGEPVVEGGPDEERWRDQLLNALMNLHPAAFERVAQRLLREAGFLSATVTGRSGDGGIDGLGVYRLSLLSFPVFFQCKRYRGSVGAPAVRDFRGAMAGRGEKGLLITTGTFTAAARAEATRDGAPPVDLIDGDTLCDLLREHRLGVSVTERTVEDVVVDVSFFRSVAGG